MIISGHVNYFTVSECGLYKHSDDQPHGIGLAETLKVVADWVRGKALADTLPWDPSETRTNASKCYCRDLYHDEASGEYVFVLWKSDTDNVGSLLGAQEDAQTGEGDVFEYTNNYKGKKVIWGRPCYYWIIPKQDLILSIKFEHSVCDSVMMQEWFLRAITNRAHHPNKLCETTQSGQVRFTFTNGRDRISRFGFRFSVRLKTFETAAAELTKLAGRVTHLVRRETIRLDKGVDERAKWLKLFDGIKYIGTKHKATSRQIEVRAEAKPTADELKAIIEIFSKENRKRSDWDNVGFQTDDNTTVWVDRYRLHSSININQEKVGVLKAVDLFTRLNDKRSELLRGLRAAERQQRAG